MPTLESKGRRQKLGIEYTPGLANLAFGVPKTLVLVASALEGVAVMRVRPHTAAPIPVPGASETLR